MKFIKIKLGLILIFGIVLIFLAFAFTEKSFLSAQLTEIEGISSEDYSYEGENIEIQGDVMVCKEGFENCKIQVTPTGGGAINLELSQGAEYDPASGKISVTESGANFTINGNSFPNIEFGYIILNQNTGEISEAKFTTNAEGGNYDFGVVSFSVTQGNIDFSLDKSSLILPKDSTLQDFNNELFYKKFENEGLIVEGENLEISDELSNKIFGNPKNVFKRFSGKIGVGQAKELINTKEGLLKNTPDKYFLFVPEKETISFLDVGIDIGTGLKKTFISFRGNRENIANLESTIGPGIVGLMEGNFIIEPGGYPSYVSLAEDRVYMDSGVLKDKHSISLTFKENSHYAGFDIREKGYFSFTLDAGSAELNEGKISIIEKGTPSVFYIKDDGDAFENILKRINFNPGKGQVKTTPVGFELLIKNKNILSIPNPEFYEEVAKKGAIPKQLYFASFSKEYPLIYLDRSTGKRKEFTSETNGRGIITLSEAYKERSEIANFYYNTLFSK